MTSVLMALDGGGEARIVETDGERVVLESSRVFPPGSTIQGAAAVGALRVKVRSCAKADAGFRIEGRFLNLSREVKRALTSP